MTRSLRIVTRQLSTPAVAGLVVAVGLTLGACGGSDGEPENNRIGPIEGPATVTDDGGAELDGAPATAADEITDGS